MLYKKAFSLIELSIVILIIGVIIAGTVQSSVLVNKFKLSNAVTQTQSSAVASTENLEYWFESTRPESFVENIQDGDRVTIWRSINPQSTAEFSLSIGSNLCDASEPTNKCPTYVQEGIGGLPSLDFNADYISSNNFQIGEDYSIFMVFEVGQNSNQAAVFAAFENGTHGVLLEVKNTRTIRSLHRFPVGLSGGDDIYSTNTLSIEKNYIYSQVRNKQKNSNKVGINSQNYITGDATGAGFSSNLTLMLGRLNFNVEEPREFLGKISELIIFSRPLKDSEVEDVENYLSKKWSIDLVR
jgi:prepilin-type N-terminal cleavage/methylation domain-containing protein